MEKYYTFPEATISLTKIMEYFSFLELEFEYTIISKKVPSQYYVQIIYENRNKNRIIVIYNGTYSVDYGFSVFIYDGENYKGNKPAINILNKPYEEQDKECIFIKNASQYLYKNYSKLVEDSVGKIIKLKW